MEFVKVDGLSREQCFDTYYERSSHSSHRTGGVIGYKTVRQQVNGRKYIVKIPILISDDLIDIGYLFRLKLRFQLGLT